MRILSPLLNEEKMVMSSMFLVIRFLFLGVRQRIGRPLHCVKVWDECVLLGHGDGVVDCYVS